MSIDKYSKIEYNICRLTRFSLLSVEKGEKMDLKNNLDFVDCIFKVKTRYTNEQAFVRLKEDVEEMQPRGDWMFKDFFYKNISKAKTRLVYAPIYHVFTEGEFYWKENKTINVGNSFVGNVYHTFQESKHMNDNSHFVVHRNEIVYGGKAILDWCSYQDHIKSALECINGNELSSVPLHTSLLTEKQIITEVAERLSDNHIGKYNASGLSIMLVLLPVLEIEYTFFSNTYMFYVNMYSGVTDVWEVPIDRRIEKTAQRTFKAEKFFKIFKTVLCCTFIFDLILGLFKNPNENGFFYFELIATLVCAGIMFFPRNDQLGTAKEIKKTYEDSDKYIKNNGKITFKLFMHFAGLVIQTLIITAVGFFITVGAISL